MKIIIAKKNEIKKSIEIVASDIVRAISSRWHARSNECRNWY